MLTGMAVLALLLLAAVPPPALDKTLSDLASVPAGPERTLAASAMLLGTPYEKEPLGEGQAPHPRPRLRLDFMDCQTFVETAMALGQADDEAELRAALDDLRYGGAPEYAQRNHFMMSQWVPRNAARGYLKEVTRALFPDAQTATKTVTAQSWENRWPKQIQLPKDQVPVGEHQLDYVTLKELASNVGRVPSGTLLLWVRAEAPHYPDRVTHLGFLVRQGNKVLLRHESDVYHRAVDEAFDHFVARNSRYEWKVLGASLFEIQDNGAHVRNLGKSGGLSATSESPRVK
jgi:hypothetical protein